MLLRVLKINFIKIFPEIALKYFFEKNVVLYEIYRKKSKVANTYVYGLYIVAHQIPYIRICADTHFISYISSPL